MSKSKNISLWILQILLGLYFLAGGVYLLGHYKIVTTMQALQILPSSFWLALGVVQILASLGLIFSNLIKKPRLVFVSAICLAAISLLGIVLYPQYSGGGIFWALIPGILAFLVASARKK